MGRGFALLFAVVLASSCLAACEAVSFEPGDGGPSGITGGNETEAAAALAAQSPPGPPFQYSPLTPGNTWTALYADYFGAPETADGGQTGGRAACSGTPGACHDAPSSTGALGSGGYVCPGDDKDACYTSLTSPELGLFTPDTPFQSDLLYAYLHSTANLNGNMPMGPPAAYPTAYTFTDVDIQRLSAWVDAGFPNN